MNKIIEAYNKLLPTEYEEKFKLFFNELDATAATEVCAELELFYLKKMRETEESHIADIKRLDDALQKTIDTIDKFSTKSIPVHTDGDGGELPENYWGKERLLGDITYEAKK